MVDYGQAVLSGQVAIPIMGRSAMRARLGKPDCKAVTTIASTSRDCGVMPDMAIFVLACCEP